MKEVLSSQNWTECRHLHIVGQGTNVILQVLCNLGWARLLNTESGSMFSVSSPSAKLSPARSLTTGQFLWLPFTCSLWELHIGILSVEVSGFSQIQVWTLNLSCRRISSSTLLHDHGSGCLEWDHFSAIVCAKTLWDQYAMLSLQIPAANSSFHPSMASWNCLFVLVSSLSTLALIPLKLPLSRL